MPLTGIDQVTIEVRHQPAPTVTITQPADNAFILFGDPATFSATASDTVDGDLGATITWQSSLDGDLGMGATIDPTLSRGTHTITASVTNSADLIGTATITVVVQSAPVVGILAPTDAAVVPFGDPVTFTGVATDFEDGDISNRIEWASNLDDDLGTDSTITVVLSRGVHTITATATDNSNHSTSAQIGLKVSARPSITITAPAANAVFAHGPVVLTGVASDIEDGDVSAGITWSSSLEPGTLGTGASITANGLRSGTHVITARATDSDALFREQQVTIVVNDPPVVEITTPPDSFPYGTPATFAATATDTEDGDIADRITWTSDKDGALGTGSSITSSTLSIGVHNITARVTDDGGRSGQATRAYTVLGPPALTITGPASGSTFEHGATVTLTGTASDPEDGDLSSQIDWMSNLDNSLGSGASLPVDTLSSGTHTISAIVTDQDGLTDSKQITITVDSTPQVSISAPADNATFEPGTTITFTGAATDFEEGDLSGSIAWSAAPGGSLGSGASVNTSTLAAGSHVITASVTDAGGKTGTAGITITVNATPTVEITAPADNSSFAPGTDVTFTATAADAEDGSLTANLAWQSNRDGSLGTGGTVSRSDLSTGTHTITASASDGSGKTGTAQITITIDAYPTVGILAPADNSIFAPGAVVNLTGTASDPEDGNRTGSIVWISNLDGELGTGGTVSVSTLRSGTHTITARVTDTTGKTAEAQRTIVIEGSPVVTITSPANGASYSLNQNVILDATAVDAEDGVLTATIVWTSSLLPNSLGTGGHVETTTLPPGTHIITATASDTGNRTGSASRTVVIEGIPVVAITAPAEGATFVPGDTVHFTGSASDAEDGDITASIVWTSDLDGQLGFGGSIDVTSLRAGTHTITATATDSANHQSMAQRTVNVNTPPFVTIDSPADGALVPANTPVDFTASANDAENGDRSASIVWRVDDQPAGIGPGLSVSLGPGAHLVEASVQDLAGASGVAAIGVFADSPPSVAIVAPANGSSFPSGTPVTFSANGSDPEDGPLAVAWISDLDGPLGNASSIEVDNLTPGTHTITAGVADSVNQVATDQITITIVP